ncbi:hypothetical protein J6590_082119 [Homalodisca vitripennis]|nr:hypothetical protein J6590_082119 [Homalodisca vitripennis]
MALLFVVLVHVHCCRQPQPGPAFHEWNHAGLRFICRKERRCGSFRVHSWADAAAAVSSTYSPWGSVRAGRANDCLFSSSSSYTSFAADNLSLDPLPKSGIMLA